MHRSRLRADDGFTLVELLVVVLIVGILAAIGLAMLLNQREKAQDAEAKSAVNAAAKAILIYGTQNDGFQDAAPSDLAKIEISLDRARGLTVVSDERTFVVSVKSASLAGTRFTVRQGAAGDIERSCDKPGVGGCPAPDGRW
jgi:type IV pilus assembly protein PilA